MGGAATQPWVWPDEVAEAAVLPTGAVPTLRFAGPVIPIVAKPVQAWGLLLGKFLGIKGSSNVQDVQVGQRLVSPVALFAIPSGPEWGIPSNIEYPVISPGTQSECSWG